MDKKGLNKLLIKVASGDEMAFEKLYTETRKGIYALVYPYFKNTQDTEDALQEIYIRIKDKVHLYKKNTDARAWLFQLAKNYALNMLRTKTRNDSYISESEEEQITDSNHGSIDKSMFILMQKVLSEEEYEIVIKYILMGYKHREIAEEMNIPLGTVLYKYQNALNKVRKELE